MTSQIDPDFITSTPVSKTGMRLQLQRARDEISALQDREVFVDEFLPTNYIDGVTDCTSAIQTAVGKGGVTRFSNKNYRVTSPIAITRSGSILRGVGPGYTPGSGTKITADGNFDVFVVGYQTNQLWGFMVEDMHITTTATMTTGRIINAQNVAFLSTGNLVVTDMASFAYLRKAFCVWFKDTWCNVQRGGPVTYGLYLDGSVDRSDVIVLDNFTFGNGVEDVRYAMNNRASGIIIDGDVNTIAMHSARLVGVDRGIWTRNTGSKPAGQRCNYIMAYDLEIDYTYNEPLRFENGNTMSFTDLYINTGLDPTNAIYIAALASRVSFKNGQVYGGKQHTTLNLGDTISYIDMWCGGGGFSAVNTYSAHYLGPTANSVAVIGGFAGGWDHVLGAYAYGVAVDAAATNIRLVGVDLTNNRTSAFLNSGSTTLSVIACPGAVNQVVGELTAASFRINTNVYVRVDNTGTFINTAPNTYIVYDPVATAWAFVTNGVIIARLNASGNLSIRGTLSQNVIM